MHNSKAFLSFLWKGFLILIPFLVYMIYIAIIDPFDFFTRFGSSKSEIKEIYSSKINEPLWHLTRYKSNPAENILLGDSRIALFNALYLKKITGKNFYNLSYGSANLKEIINTFWFTTSVTKIKSVYIGLNLELYNQVNNRDRVSGVIRIFANPMLYFTNLNVMEGSYQYLKAKLFGIDRHWQKPAMSVDEFWQFQLQTAGSRYFDQYVYPELYYRELMKIAQYCKDNKIQLTFIVPPTHLDLQELLKSKGLNAAEKKFIEDLSRLGETFDFNISNEFTNKKDNFNDPFHAKPQFYDSISNIVFDRSLRSTKFTSQLCNHYSGNPIN